MWRRLTHTLPSGKPKVDDLDLMTRPIHTKDVLWLKAEQLVRHARSTLVFLQLNVWQWVIPLGRGEGRTSGACTGHPRRSASQTPLRPLQSGGSSHPQSSQTAHLLPHCRSFRSFNSIYFNNASKELYRSIDTEKYKKILKLSYYLSLNVLIITDLDLLWCSIKSLFFFTIVNMIS